MKNGVGFVILTAAFSLPAAGRTLATIDGDPVSDEALVQAAEPLGRRAETMLGDPVLRRQYLDRLIDTRLMAKAAKAAGVTKTPAYKAQLAAAQTRILADLYAADYVHKHLNDVELKRYFERDKTRYSDEEVHVAHIIVGDAAKANDLLKLLKNGADFATLAKERSQGPSAPHGGDLGFIGRGRMVPEFEEAMFSTPKGSVYPHPVKTPFGYHLVKVIDTKGSAVVVFEEVADKVRAHYTEELREQMVRELRAKAQVKVDEAAVKAFSPHVIPRP